MSVAKQLYQIQEVDLQLESNEQAQRHIARQLGESQTVIETQQKLVLEQKHLEELMRQQRSTEWEIDDITTKLAAAEEELYGGKIRNPKELTSLQHETDAQKARRRQLEDKVLEIMGQVELTVKNVATLDSEVRILKTEWQSQQQMLHRNIFIAQGLGFLAGLVNQPAKFLAQHHLSKRHLAQNSRQARDIFFQFGFQKRQINFQFFQKGFNYPAFLQNQSQRQMQNIYLGLSPLAGKIMRVAQGLLGFNCELVYLHEFI